MRKALYKYWSILWKCTFWHSEKGTQWLNLNHTVWLVIYLIGVISALEQLLLLPTLYVMVIFHLLAWVTQHELQSQSPEAWTSCSTNRWEWELVSVCIVCMAEALYKGKPGINLNLWTDRHGHIIKMGGRAALRPEWEKRHQQWLIGWLEHQSACHFLNIGSNKINQEMLFRIMPKKKHLWFPKEP